MNRNLLKTPTGWRQTSWLFTKRAGVEFGATEDKSIQWQGGGLEPGTSGLQAQRPNHQATLASSSCKHAHAYTHNSMQQKGPPPNFINPLQPIISIYILHTVPCTFTKVLTRRICQTIKFLQLVIISFTLMTLMCDLVVIL